MGVFTFVIILVLITTLGKAAIALGRPMAEHAGGLLEEMVAERRARREALESGVRLDSVVVEELETRLARIEDRLDFLEELRAPATPEAIAATAPGSSPDPGSP